jgi:hypothetical protein
MSTLLLTYDPLYTRIFLAALAIVLTLAYLLYYDRHVRPARLAASSQKKTPPPARPHLFEYSPRPGASMFGIAMRGALILLALCVAVGLALILLPDNAVNRSADLIRMRNGQPPPQERISLLYLGDEVKGKEFHIRGAIRNISTQPMEKLDAMIRLYAPNGILLETAVVRMELEMIAPDGISTFHLTYPDYDGQFSSYSVDFKLRDGELLPYKDMRSTHTGS